jgi:hypothetical protein
MNKISALPTLPLSTLHDSEVKSSLTLNITSGRSQLQTKSTHHRNQKTTDKEYKTLS